MREALVKVSDVSKTFHDGNTDIEVLHPLSFELHAGQFVAIVGPSGSGKSTLLTLLGGLQKPTAGTISIGGRDLTGMSNREVVATRLQDIGFVFQASNLVPYLTLWDQLVLQARAAKQDFDTERAARLFEDLNITKLKDKMPGDISGGERQRAAIVRALYPRPKLLLADEPTASLDSNRAFKVVDILAEQAHTNDVTVVMVTHDERMLRQCDRILRIEDGTLSENNRATAQTEEIAQVSPAPRGGGLGGVMRDLRQRWS